VVVVGGFAESDYVFSRLQEWAQMKSLTIIKPDGSFKAIAHGGLSWHIGSSVQIRISKLHYGAESDDDFSNDDPDLIGRKKYQNVLGQWRVRSVWTTIISKVRSFLFIKLSRS